LEIRIVGTTLNAERAPLSGVAMPWQAHESATDSVSPRAPGSMLAARNAVFAGDRRASALRNVLRR